MHTSTKFYLENLKGRYNFGDSGIDERIIFKYILKKRVMMVCIVFTWLKIWPSGGLP
jgi:hypothetical protein